MLRFLLLALILANGLYFAWTQGLLRAYGFAPTQQSEPQRLDQQIHPEAFRVLTPAESKRMEEKAKAASLPTQCLVAGPFDVAQSDTLRQALVANLPEGSWQLNEVPVAERWIVYMGKYTDAAALDKKRSELAALKIAAEQVQASALAPGLSLGGFGSKQAADTALAAMSSRGVRTARVVQERASSTGFELRLPAASRALDAPLEHIKPQLAGAQLHRCPESGQ